MGHLWGFPGGGCSSVLTSEFSQLRNKQGQPNKGHIPAPCAEDETFWKSVWAAWAWAHNGTLATYPRTEVLGPIGGVRRAEQKGRSWRTHILKEYSPQSQTPLTAYSVLGADTLVVGGPLTSSVRQSTPAPVMWKEGRGGVRDLNRSLRHSQGNWRLFSCLSLAEL